MRHNLNLCLGKILIKALLWMKSKIIQIMLIQLIFSNLNHLKILIMFKKMKIIKKKMKFNNNKLKN